MLVLGIDPGSTVTGYGVVRTSRGRLHYVDSGVVRTSSKQPMAARLAKIHDGLCEALDRHSPDQVAIEDIFRHKSSESALRLGQARGVALLAAGQRGFEPSPYNAMVVKKTVGAHGGADKKAIARMVRMLLGLSEEVVDAMPSDATDALAIAITHCRFSRMPPGVR